MESDNEDTPLLQPKPLKRKFHSRILIYCIITDLFSSFALYILYIILNPGYLDGFPKAEQLIPLDLLLLAICRVVLLRIFAYWKGTMGLPLITTIVSLGYLVGRAKIATTVIAFVILGVQFCMCWAETGCYIHAMLIHGNTYWDNQFQIDDIDEEDEVLDFVFPELPYEGYHRPGPVEIQSDIQDTSVTMGTSAPILINTPKRFVKEDFSRSVTFDRIIEHPTENQGIDCSSDVFTNYLKRSSELSQCIQHLKTNHFQQCELILISNSRHLILPRFQVLWLCMFLLRNPDQIMLMRARLSQAKQVVESMKTIQDSQGISLSLSDMITLDIHKLACQMTPVGSLIDSPAATPENHFWKLWKIDVDTCLAMIILLQGLEQIWHGRYLKGSVNISRSWRLMKSLKIDLSKFEPIAADGMVGGCLSTLHSAIEDTLDFITAWFHLIPYLFPFVRDSFLKHIDMDDDRSKGISILYKLSQSKSIGIPSLLGLLFVLQHQTPSFLCLSSDQHYREQLTILTMVDSHSLDVVTYLMALSYKRLGRVDFATMQTQKPVSNISMQTWIEFEKGNCLALQSKWTDSLEVFSALWNRVKIRQRDGVVQPLDLWIGLSFCGVSMFVVPNTIELDYLDNTLIPLLEQSQSKVVPLAVKSTIQYFRSSPSRGLLFWVWYLRGDLTLLASSPASISILAGLEQQLQGNDIFCRFLKAVMAKYLAYHHFGEHRMEGTRMVFEQCKQTLLDCFVNFEVAEYEWIKGNAKEARKALGNVEQSSMLPIAREKGESPVPSFLKKERDQRDMVSSICTNEDIIVDIEHDIKCKNAMLLLQ